MKSKFKILITISLVLIVAVNAIGLGFIIYEEKKQTKEAQFQSDMAYFMAWESAELMATQDPSRAGLFQAIINNYQNSEYFDRLMTYP